MRLTIEVKSLCPITNEKGEKEWGLNVGTQIYSDREDTDTVCPEQVNHLLKVQEVILKAIKAYKPDGT